YYAPNNATAVIVGDVDANEVERLAEKYFGPIPAQTPPPPVRTIEPEQTGERRVSVHKPSASSVNILLAYHIPASDHDDTLAIDLLSDILISGRSSRLYRRLVDEEQLATEIWGYRPDAFDPTLLYFYAVATPSTDAPTLEAALIDELKRIRLDSVSDTELQKVKNQRRVAIYSGFSTINGKADLLGSYEVFYDDYHRALSLSDRYNAVTKDDVQTVAERYLRKTNRTVGILSPEQDRD
ncbi:MAG: insulinase family protein, partial [Gammaproteobacteria bacterium]|nr:insulinase family protein [Gammaproteobacteria bacterium]